MKEQTKQPRKLFLYKYKSEDTLFPNERKQLTTEDNETLLIECMQWLILYPNGKLEICFESVPS